MSTPETEGSRVAPTPGWKSKRRVRPKQAPSWRRKGIVTVLAATASVGPAVAPPPQADSESARPKTATGRRRDVMSGSELGKA